MGLEGGVQQMKTAIGPAHRAPFFIDYVFDAQKLMMSDDIIKMYFWNFHILTTWSESAPQNKHMLTILDEYCQNGLNYEHLKAETLPYKPLYFSSGSKRLEPDTKYSDLIGTISTFNCLYFGHYLPYRAEICQ